MKKIITAISGVLLFASCVNLEHINTYAGNSVESIESFHSINFSFYTFCAQYSADAIANNLHTDIKDATPPDCSVFKNSDSALHIMHQVLLLYLQGLEKISEKDLVNYSLDTTVDNLQSLQSKLNFSLSDKQVTSAKNIVTKILNASLNAYRKKRIQAILLKTKGDFDNVMNAYITGINALNAEADAALVNYKTLYTYYFLQHAKDDEIKILAVNDYKKTQNDFKRITESIDTYLQSLQAVKDGYDGLSASAKNLTSHQLKNLLKQADEKMQSLKEQFENLKK